MNFIILNHIYNFSKQLA